MTIEPYVRQIMETFWLSEIRAIKCGKMNETPYEIIALDLLHRGPPMTSVLRNRGKSDHRAVCVNKIENLVAFLRSKWDGDGGKSDQRARCGKTNRTALAF